MCVPKVTSHPLPPTQYTPPRPENLSLRMIDRSLLLRGLKKRTRERHRHCCCCCVFRFRYGPRNREILPKADHKQTRLEIRRLRASDSLPPLSCLVLSCLVWLDCWPGPAACFAAVSEYAAFASLLLLPLLLLLVAPAFLLLLLLLLLSMTRSLASSSGSRRFQYNGKMKMKQNQKQQMPTTPTGKTKDKTHETPSQDERENPLPREPKHGKKKKKKGPVLRYVRAPPPPHPSLLLVPSRRPLPALQKPLSLNKTSVVLRGNERGLSPFYQSYF